MQIYLPSIEKYQRSKFTREEVIFQGERVFDAEKGHLNVLMVAKLLRIKTYQVYNLIKRGEIKVHKKGRWNVIYREELEKTFDLKNRDLFTSKIC